MNELTRRKARFLIGFWLLILIYLLPSTALAASAGKKLQSTTGLAEVNGTRLYYETAGKGKNVLVFIHGGLVDSRLWDDQFKEFARNFRVVRYDLRGFGKSDFPDYDKPFSHVEDLHALLKFLKIEKASLVGLSLGGMIAADFTLEHPEMVEKLVLTSSGLRGDKSPRNQQSLAVYKAAEEKGAETAINMWMEHPFFVTGKNSEKYQQRARQMLADNYKYWGPTPKTIQVVWAKQPTIERLSEIKAPTLIIVGTKDIPAMLTIAQTLATRISGAELAIISGVSHHLNMEVPVNYNNTLLKFLKRKL